MKVIIAGVAAAGLLAAVGTGAGMLNRTGEVSQNVAGERAAARLADLGFLAGVWTGDMGGSYVEEAWSVPRGNNIIGYFRWLRPDGRPMLFEILTITEEEGTLHLRLRHYSATLQGKEPQEKPMTLRLESAAGKRAVFTAEKVAGDLSRIEYSVAEDTLTITVGFVEEDRPPLVFKLKKM